MFFYNEQDSQISTILEDGSTAETAPPNARELAQAGYPSGVYWIQPEGQVAKQTYVDMSNDDGSGGGWVKIHSAWTGGSAQDRTNDGSNEIVLQSSTYTSQEAIMPSAWMNSTSFEAWRVINEELSERKVRMYWSKVEADMSDNSKWAYHTTDSAVYGGTLSDLKGTYKWGSGPTTWRSDIFDKSEAAAHGLGLGAWNFGPNHYPGAGGFHLCLNRWCCAEHPIGVWFNYFPWPAYDDSGLISGTGRTYNATGWAR
jgi:hypothetical protein